MKPVSSTSPMPESTFVPVSYHAGLFNWSSGQRSKETFNGLEAQVTDMAATQSTISFILALFSCIALAVCLLKYQVFKLDNFFI